MRDLSCGLSRCYLCLCRVEGVRHSPRWHCSLLLCIEKPERLRPEKCSTEKLHRLCMPDPFPPCVIDTFLPNFNEAGGCISCAFYLKLPSRVPIAHFHRGGHQQLDHAPVSLAMPATTVDSLRESGMRTGCHLYSSFTLGQIRLCEAENKV